MLVVGGSVVDLLICSIVAMLWLEMIGNGGWRMFQAWGHELCGKAVIHYFLICLNT